MTFELDLTQAPPGIPGVNNKAALDHEESAKDRIDTGLNSPRPSQPIQDIHALWHADVNAWIVDMSAANGTFLVFGAFEDMDRHRAFETVSDQIEFDRAIEPEMAVLEEPGWPEDLDDRTAKDLGLALWKEALLESNSRQQFSFYYAIAASAAEALEVARQAKSETRFAWGLRRCRSTMATAVGNVGERGASDCRGMPRPAGRGRMTTASNRLRIVIFGLSITSSWGNGHATTYRALARALARRGHRVTFL